MKVNLFQLVFFCLHNQFGCERAEAPLPVKKQTQAFWLSASSPGCQTTVTAVPITPSAARKISVCSKCLVKQWLAQPSGNLDSSFNFDLMHYSPAPVSLTCVMLLLKKCLSTFQQDELDLGIEGGWDSCILGTDSFSSPYPEG